MSTVDAAVTASTHAAAGGNGVQNSQDSERNWFKIAVVCTYILFLMLPIYWLLNMSFKTNQEILSTFSLWPKDFTFDNYATIFTDPRGIAVISIR